MAVSNALSNADTMANTNTISFTDSYALSNLNSDAKSDKCARI
jgi:hypothetical protein